MTPDRRPDLTRLFRDESNERLDRIVEMLLAAERDPPSDETIRALFREVHSIKGGAGMFGADEAYEVADAIEDALAEARSAGVLEPALVDPLLHAVDALRDCVEDRQGSEDAVAALAAARSRLATGSTGAAAQGPSEPTARTPAPETPESRAATAETPVLAQHAAARPEPADRSVRVDVGKIDRLLDVAGEAALRQRRLERAARGDGPDRAGDVGGDGVLEELQDAVIALRMLPLDSITGGFQRMVRDLAAEQGKQAALSVSGGDTQVDRAVLDGTSEALGHLLRNAIAHGIEPPSERVEAGKSLAGRVELRAAQRGDRVAIEVADDGRGVAPELVRQARRGGSLAEVLAQAGLSTAATVTAAAGRGVGMDAVRNHVERLSGELSVRSQPGRGTVVSMLLPVSLALPRVLLIRRGGITFGVPLTAVAEITVIEDRLALGSERAVEMQGRQLPVADLLTALGAGGPALAARCPAIVAASEAGRAVLLCDEVLDDQEVLVKPLGPVLDPLVSGYAGAAVTVEGDVALVLDIPRVIAALDRRGGGAASAPAEPATRRAPTVLVVDDQFTVRELQRSILETAGCEVRTARDGAEAWSMLSGGADVNVVLTDVEMPGMDGLELAAAIRRAPWGASLPIVMVTSRGSDEDRRRGLEAGADAYIVKEGFDQRSLIDTIRRLLPS